MTKNTTQNYTDAENICYANLHQEWELHLKSHGVKLMKQDTHLGCALLYLYMNLEKSIHIDQIKNFVVNKGFILTGTDPLQVRHLSTQKGFHIVKDGRFKHSLVSIKKPTPAFIREKRVIRLTSDIWNALLKEYDYQCVNCGSEEGKPMRWKKSEITKLQKGHMDPRKELTEANCIPQCSFCNQQYKNKAIFNKRGQVIKLL